MNFNAIPTKCLFAVAILQPIIFIFLAHMFHIYYYLLLVYVSHLLPEQNMFTMKKKTCVWLNSIF